MTGRAGIGSHALLVATLLTVWLAGVATADGLTVWAQPEGEAGLQMDVAKISPRLATPRPTFTRSRRYVVQPGETLSQIAEQFGLTTAELAAINGVTDPDQVQAGQVLRMRTGVEARPTLPEDGPLTRLQFWPWPPTQGQTLVLWLTARGPTSARVVMGGQAYQVQVRGRHGWVMIPIPALAEPGTTRLVLEIAGASLRLDVPIQAGDFGYYAVPANVSAPILAHQEKVQTEAERLLALFSNTSDHGWTSRSRFSSPLNGEYLHTSPFGTRRTYGNSPDISAHSGEDFSAPAGTPVLAPAAGLVVLAEPLFVRGNAVVLDHGHGVYTGYWHLQTLNVSAGDQVAPGDLLGEVGSTGLSTGPHLHWELRIGAIPVDPLQWLAP